MMNPALPGIAHDLGVSIADATWSTTAFLIAAAVSTPVLGAMGESHGRKRLLAAALAALAVGSVICAAAPNLGWLVTGRAVQGLGSAIFPLAFAIVREVFPADRGPQATARVSAAMGLGFFGVAVTGPVVDHGSFRWLFALTALTCAVATVAVTVAVPSPAVRPAGGRVTWAGVLPLSAGLVGLMLALAEGNDWGWQSARVLGLLVTAPVLLGVWAAVEKRAPAPMIDLDVLRIRTVWATNVASVFSGCAVMGGLLLLPQVLCLDNAGFGYGATQTGFRLLPLAAAMMIGAPLAGAWHRRAGARAPMVWGCALMAAAFGAMRLGVDNYWQLLVPIVMMGLAGGLTLAAMTNLVVGAVGPGQAGVAAGVNTVFRTVGMALGSALVVLATTARSGGDGTVSAADLHSGLLVCAVAATLAFGYAALIPAHGHPRAARLRAWIRRRGAALILTSPGGGSAPRSHRRDRRGSAVQGEFRRVVVENAKSKTSAAPGV